MKKLLRITLIAVAFSIPSAYAGSSIVGNWHFTKTGVPRAHGPDIGDYGVFVTATGQMPLSSREMDAMHLLGGLTGTYNTGTPIGSHDRSVSAGWAVFTGRIKHLVEEGVSEVKSTISSSGIGK